MQLICASCSGLAPAKKQWFNQDTGYGICPRCWSKVLGRELIVQGPIEGLTWMSTTNQPAKRTQGNCRTLDTYNASLHNESPPRVEEVTEIQNEDGELICYASPERALLLCTAGTTANAIDAETEYDGQRCVEALPELLKALEACLAQMPEPVSAMSDESTRSDEDEQYEQLSAILAKCRKEKP